MPLHVPLSLPLRSSRSGRVVVEEEVQRSTSHHLKANLNDKELQQEDYRLHYIRLLARSKKWEKALQLKDSAFCHLQQAVEDRDITIKRQEKLIEETKQRLIFQGKSEKAQLEKKELEISLLKARNIQQAEKLAEQTKLITVLNSQKEKREQELIAYSNHVKRKVESLKGQLQNAEASLHSREEELEAHKRYCNELKLVIWKKDRMLEKSKLIGEQLQSALKRKHMVCETLEAANNELRGANSHMAKNLREMRRHSEACEFAAQHDLKMQASCLQKQKHQIQKLEMILSKKESCLHAKSMELEASYKETNRLVEEYNKLNENYESLAHDYMQLQWRLRSLEQKIKITEKYSSRNANSPCAEFLEDNFIPPECGAINQDYCNTAYETEDARLPREIEASSRAGMNKPWHTPSLFQNYFNDGVSLTGNMERPENGNLSTSGNDLHEEQLCLVNELAAPVDGMHAMLALDDAKQCQVDGNSSLWAVCPLTRSSNTRFPKSGSSARKQWSLSRPTLNLADSMETKVELKDTINSAQCNTSDAAQSSTSLELQKIQEEIRERERSWKQIEASMRAELNRRKVQLHGVNIL